MNAWVDKTSCCRRESWRAEPPDGSVRSAPMAIRQREAGVALIEVILAVALFGMAALGILQALTLMSQAANNAKMELRMMAVLESTLTQFARQPTIEETARPIISEPDESGVWTETRIIEMNEKNGNLLQTDESEQGGRQQLQQMYHIIVTAYWEFGGLRGETTADTYRYGPLFQQTGAGTP